MLKYAGEAGDACSAALGEAGEATGQWKERSNPSTTSLIDREDIIDTDKDKAELFARAFAKISA